MLQGTLTLLSGLHIGAGRALGTGVSDLPVLKDIQGTPFIPGSSLKGVLRSTVEAFLRSFQGTRAYLACCPVGGDESSSDPTRRPCITRSRMETLRQRAQEAALRGQRFDIDAQVWEESCWICQAFGSSWIASKLRFSDVTLSSPWVPELLAVRDGVAIDRESETAAAGLKFDFEVVPPGTLFQVNILAENPDPRELGILMLAMELLNDGFALLGGDTSRGLGRVRFSLDEVVEITPQKILERLHTEQAPLAEEKQPTEATLTPEAHDDPSSLSIDEAQQTARACLQDAQSLDHNGLVAVMQQQGWTKARLNQLGYGNWKELFEEAVRAGAIERAGEHFQLPGVGHVEATQSYETSNPNAGEETKASERNEASDKAKEWKEALYRKLKDALEGGEECSTASITKPESSTSSNP
jgi:CRISPR-associated RAMP protein (TIGR02581 family)